MPIAFCLGFRAHQPYRLARYNYFDVGRKHDYFEETERDAEASRAAGERYLPALLSLESLLERHAKFAVCFSLSGRALERLGEEAPATRDAFRRLAARGHAEFLAETSHRSMAWIASRREFEAQVAQQREGLAAELNVEPRVFDAGARWDDTLSRYLGQNGFDGLVADASAASAPPGRAIRRRGSEGLPVLGRDVRLARELSAWCAGEGPAPSPIVPRGQLVTLGLDLDSFGGRPGAFERLRGWIEERLSRGSRFLTPSDAIRTLPEAEAVEAPASWTPNDLQRDALRSLFALEARVTASGAPDLESDFRRLTACDHFDFMAAEGDSETAGSPYESRYEAYMRFRHAVSDLERRVVSRRAALSATARVGPPRLLPPT